MKKLFTHPVAQAVTTIIVVLVALSFARPHLTKVPLLNRI